ncbi:hypothetical protein EJ08DRAFT_662202 [Tothia fuscella]|uniref:Uncharacterized protein n=1 Tax=Tothia fuscella TaxID=1048955 RepID=A0A9P4TXG0_9PEZI|nr:hypothetical protein EJ08DRAFT_662202 [Tothia fuscella]
MSQETGKSQRTGGWASRVQCVDSESTPRQIILVPSTTYSVDVQSEELSEGTPRDGENIWTCKLYWESRFMASGAGKFEIFELGEQFFGDANAAKTRRTTSEPGTSTVRAASDSYFEIFYEGKFIIMANNWTLDTYVVFMALQMAARPQIEQ